MTWGGGPEEERAPRKACSAQTSSGDRSRQSQVRAGGCCGREEMGKVGRDFAGHTRGSDFVLRAVEMPSEPGRLCSPLRPGAARLGRGAQRDLREGAGPCGRVSRAPPRTWRVGWPWAPCEARGGGLPGLGKAVLDRVPLLRVRGLRTHCASSASSSTSPFSYHFGATPRC